MEKTALEIENLSLYKEIADLTLRLKSVSDQWRAQCEMAKDARNELSVLKADASRYRWLRRQPNDSDVSRIDVTRWINDGYDNVNSGEGLRMEELDSAIDDQL